MVNYRPVLHPDTGRPLLNEAGIPKIYDADLYPDGPPPGCCCEEPPCCSHKPATLTVTLESLIDEDPDTCSDTPVDVGLSWTITYDPVNDWWHGWHPTAGLGLRVRCERLEDGTCTWHAHAYCEETPSNFDREPTVLSWNPVELETDMLWFGAIAECDCVDEFGNPVIPQFYISIVE